MTPCASHYCDGEARYCQTCLDMTVEACTGNWRDDRREREGFRSLLRYLHLHCMLTTTQLGRITGLDRQDLRLLMDYDTEAERRDP